MARDIEDDFIDAAEYESTCIDVDILLASLAHLYRAFSGVPHGRGRTWVEVSALREAKDLLAEFGEEV